MHATFALVAALTAAVLAQPVTPTSATTVLEVWQPFLKQRFGKEGVGAWSGDFNQDGVDDLATRIGDMILVFTKLEGDKPEAWTALLARSADPIAIRPSSWAAERIPDLKGKLPMTGAVLTVGDHAPLVFFWSAEKSAFVRWQVIPTSLASAAADARTRVPGAFEISAAQLCGDAGFEGTRPLRRFFVGDYDGDKKSELVVLDGDALLHYSPGSRVPTMHKPPFVGKKAWRVRNQRTTVDPPDWDGEPNPPVEIVGDYLSVHVPETAGAYLHFTAGRWESIHMED